MINPRRQLDLRSPWHLTWLFLTFGLAGWMLQATPTLEIDMQGDGGILQVFHSRDGLWTEAQSVPSVVLPGRRTVSVPLPWSLPDRLRLDPISHAGGTTVVAMRYRYLLFQSTVDPLQIRPLRDSKALSVRLDAPRGLTIRSADDDPQLSVPVPRTIAVWHALGIALSAAPLLLIGALWPWRTGQSEDDVGYQLALMLLGFAFALMVYMIGRSGAGYPIHDDWRYFYPGPFSMIEGHGRWLTMAGNDTYFLTGQLIDWALLKLSGGSTYAVRLFALTLLAIFLALASALSARHAGKWAPFALLALSLALNAKAYWSQQFMAYHQFLPILALFLVLWIAHRPNGEGLSLPARICMIVVTLAAGLAYISGSILFIVVSIAYVIAVPGSLKWAGRKRRPVFWYAGLPALLALAVQLWMVTSVQGSLLERSHAGGIAWPVEMRFWAFLIGLSGQAAGSWGNALALDSALFAVLIGLAGYALVRSVRTRPSSPRETADWFVALALFAGALAYAAMISAGRAELGTEAADASTVAAIAKWRFHYWWLAALLPVAVAISLNNLLGSNRASSALLLVLSLTVIVGKSAYVIRQDMPFFEQVRLDIREGEACVRAEIIRNGGSAGTIQCPTFYPADLGAAVRLAEQRDLGFMHELLQRPR